MCGYQLDPKTIQPALETLDWERPPTQTFIAFDSGQVCESLQDLAKCRIKKPEMWKDQSSSDAVNGRGASMRLEFLVLRLLRGENHLGSP